MFPLNCSGTGGENSVTHPPDPLRENCTCCELEMRKKSGQKPEVKEVWVSSL